MIDTRSRFRKRKDRALLKLYSRRQYQRARQKRAELEAVPLELIKHVKGHREAIHEGFRKLEGWFQGLPGPQRARARDQMREYLGTDAAVLDQEEADAAADAAEEVGS